MLVSESLRLVLTVGVELANENAEGFELSISVSSELMNRPCVLRARMTRITASRSSVLGFILNKREVMMMALILVNNLQTFL